MLRIAQPRFLNDGVLAQREYGGPIARGVSDRSRLHSLTCALRPMGPQQIGRIVIRAEMLRTVGRTEARNNGVESRAGGGGIDRPTTDKACHSLGSFLPLTVSTPSRLTVAIT
jgi:hypothetical protein